MDLVNNIERLLCDLYGENHPKSDSKDTFNETNKLLINFQKSKEAWMFAWVLMQKEKPINVQYFGASSLYVKLTKFYFELNPESYHQIWLKLIQHLVSYMEHQEFNLITTKLISCLAVCIVRNTLDTTCNNALQEVVNLFQPEKFPHLPPTRVIQILLEILSVIPDELNNPYNDKNKKMTARRELIKHVESILLFVHKVLSENNISDNITKICLKCFSSWSVGFDSLVLSEHHSSIMAMVLNCVRNENTCHEAVESIVAIYTSPHMVEQPKPVLQLIEQMTLGLGDTINKAINESNHDFLKDLYLLFVSIGESHTRIILDALIDLSLNTEIMIEFFNIILKCSSTQTYYAYDETISDMPFNFWINLQDDLMASEESKIQIYRNIFKDIFHSLINIYLFKLQYPPDEILERTWEMDDREKFRCYRQDIADTYSHCFVILNTDLLEILLEHFNKALGQIIVATSKECDKNLISSSIRYLEAVIYAFSSLTESICYTSNKFMPQIFSSFQTLPPECLNDSHLLSTINGFLSSSAEWLTGNISYIAFTLTIISNSLKSNDLLVVISATMALKVITTECQLNLSHFAPQIVSICEEFLKSPNLQYKEKARLMHSLGTILSIMPMEVIMQTVDRILIPILTETEKMLCLDKNNNSDAHIHINGVLLMLSNLFSQLDVNTEGAELRAHKLAQDRFTQNRSKEKKPQPSYKIFEKVLPMFGVIAMNYAHDEEIVQNLCECVKKTVGILLEDLKPLVVNIVELLLHLYHKSRSIAVIIISRQLFTLFHKETELLTGLQEYFYSIIQITIEAFEKDFRENTILVQNFYEQCAHALRKSPIIFLIPKLDLTIIFEWAIAGLLLPEKGTIHQCSIFITQFLNQGYYNNLFHKVVYERLEMLVMKIFIVIGGSQGSPSFAVDYIPDIIIELNQKYSDIFTRTLNAIIECNGFPTDNVTRDHKAEFAQALLSLKVNRKGLKEITKEFSYRCRGLFGVEDK